MTMTAAKLTLPCRKDCGCIKLCPGGGLATRLLKCQEIYSITAEDAIEMLMSQEESQNIDMLVRQKLCCVWYLFNFSIIPCIKYYTTLVFCRRYGTINHTWQIVCK